MTIKLHVSVADFPSVCEIIETDSFRACSVAMDDGGRCLLDVISDPLLLQSFLESGSDDNSKDPQDGTSSESAVESPQIARYPQATLSNHVTSVEHVIEPSDQMGYSYPGDSQGLLAQSAACSIGMTLGASAALIVCSSSGHPSYQHASSSRATIHHLPTSAAAPSLQHSPAPQRPHTPLSHSIRSPSQGPSSVHSMPPPSPVQQTRSPLTSHTPSPSPAWSPAPPVLSPATSRAQPAMPTMAFQQPHSQVLQTTANVTQIVTALSQQTQKLTVQQQQPLLLHPQTSPVPSPQQPARLTMTSPVVTTASVPVTPSMVQIIPAPQANVPLPIRTSHSTVRPIQPKLPQQILPKPASTAANQFVAPVVKQTNNTPVTASQRGVSVPLQPGATSQLVIGQGQPGMFSGPQSTILLNSIIPGVGQSPILIQGNLSNLTNLQGLQLTLRPPVSATSSQTLSSSGAQNNPTLIAALQSPNQPAQALFTQTKSPLHGQQTIVIPNNITSTGLTPQNLSLTPTAIRNNNIVPAASQGQGFLARSNIILSQRVVGPNQGLQLQQIQTPQGPILALAPSGTIALPHLPAALQNAALGNPQLNQGAVPMHSVVAAGQSVISGLSLQSHPQHTALHQHSTHQQQSLFSAAVPLTSQMEQPSQPVVHLPQAVPAQHIAASITTNQSTAVHLQPQENPSLKPSSPPKPSKVPSVNLEELLKEHGIVPENTPPPSPDSQSPHSEDPVPTQLHTSSSVVQSPQLIAALQSQHHVVLEQLSQSPLATTTLPQVKLALAQDGSVILQPHATFIPSSRFSHSVSQAKIATSISSTILPTVTTSAVSVPVVTTQPCTARGHSALLARLNSAPAISIPEVVTSLAIATNLGSCTSSSITSSTITTTAPMLIPLTVQSLNVSSSPTTTSHVQPVTSVSSVSGQIPIELCSSLPQSMNHVTASTVPTVLTPQNVQSRLNHVIFGFQPLITSSQQYSSVVQTVTKTVSGNVSGSVCAGSSQSTVIPPEKEKASKTDTCVIGISDNSNGAIASSHKLQSINSVVPNDMLHKEVEVENHVPAIALAGSPSVISSSIRKNQQTAITSTEQSCHLEKQQNLNKSNSSQSIHLVNLLKQNSVHNPSLQTVAPVVTVSCASNCESLRLTSITQVTSQLKASNPITPGNAVQQRHNIPHQLPNLACDNVQIKDNSMPRPRLLGLQPSANATKQSSVIHLKGKSPVIRISSASKTALINKQLTVDQNYAVTPDTKMPFISKRDACQRLLKYHVYNSKVPSLDEMRTADQMFERVSVQLLDKFRKMVNKYHLLQLKESVRPCPTPERVLLERLFQDDEKAALQRDKVVVAEGQSLNLPPMPSHWLTEMNIPSCSKLTDISNSPIKEDCDQLEAPVIDSCVDIRSPPGDVCDRSPPTLKRIVVKTERSSDTELEDPGSRKRLKIQNTAVKIENDSTEWNSDNTKACQKDKLSFNENKNVPVKCYDAYRDNRGEEDIMTKLRKELNISPLENDEDSESVVPHVDFEPPGCANGLTDFETPIARTDGPCDSTLITAYSSCTRTNSEIKYDFDMLDCPSEWVEAYANHASHNAAESEAAVESILNDHHNPSELDLSGIEELDDHLDDSQQSIPNGIRDDGDESRDSELHYNPYHIPKSRGFREDLVTENKGHTNEMQEQVQSAIKSILELQSDNRSYFDGDEVDILPRLYDLEKTSQDSRKRCRISPATYVGLDGDIGVNSETDAALDEAVRSILQ